MIDGCLGENRSMRLVLRLVFKGIMTLLETAFNPQSVRIYCLSTFFHYKNHKTTSLIASTSPLPYSPRATIDFLPYLILQSLISIFRSIMRLRKTTVKTQFNQPSHQQSRFKLLKRQTTEVLRFSHQRQNEPPMQGKLFKRFSSLMDCELAGPQFSEKLMNGAKKQPWRRIKMNFQERQDHTSIRKSKMAADQMEILNNHIASVSYKPSRSHKRTATEPCISLKSSRHLREKYTEPIEMKHFSKCCKIVDEIYLKITLLKELGYADYKINEWVLNYCDNRRPYMKDIFMKNISKSLYTMQEEYEFQKNSQCIKEKIKYKIEKGRESFFFIQTEELTEFCRYIEDILIQKNSQKAKEVESSIIQKLSNDLVPRLKNKFFVFTKKEPAEVTNFLTDLSQYQHKYGDFLSLSKVNKLRFLQLTQVQQNLKKVYQNLLESQIRKIIKESQQTHPICEKIPTKSVK